MSQQALRTLRLIVTDTCDGCAVSCDVEVVAPDAVPQSVCVTVRHREWGQPHQWREMVDAVDEELRRLKLRRDESGCREGQDPSDGPAVGAVGGLPAGRWLILVPPRVTRPRVQREKIGKVVPTDRLPARLILLEWLGSVVSPRRG